MARDLSCPSGLPAYRTKRAAEDANPNLVVRRCERCRWWHAPTKLNGRRRRRVR